MAMPRPFIDYGLIKNYVLIASLLAYAGLLYTLYDPDDFAARFGPARPNPSPTTDNEEVPLNIDTKGLTRLLKRRFALYKLSLVVLLLWFLHLEDDRALGIVGLVMIMLPVVDDTLKFYGTGGRGFRKALSGVVISAAVALGYNVLRPE